MTENKTRFIKGKNKRYNNLMLTKPDETQPILAYGKHVRELFKKSEFTGGEEIYKAVVRDILSTDNPFLGVEGCKTLLQTLILSNVNREGKYYLQRARTGKVTVVPYRFNTKDTRMKYKNIRSLAKSLGIDASGYKPFMEVYMDVLPRHRAGRAIKHALFSTKSYTGAEIIKMILKDIHNENSSEEQVRTSIQLLLDYVITDKAALVDSYYYDVIAGKNEIKIIRDRTKEVKLGVKALIHTHKTLDDLVSEYKNVPIGK